MTEETRMGDNVLLRLRDPGLPTFTWFWIKEEPSNKRNKHVAHKIISPYFNTYEEAMIWADNFPKWSIE
jgi:hypothetical protein